ERVVTSASAFNDGKWHHVAASLGANGMALYVDGKLVGSRTDTTSAQAYNGYWRIGTDNTWSGTGTFNGRVDEVAVYPTVLAADRVNAHYVLGSTGTAPNAAPTASFTASTGGRAVSLDASKSADPDGTIASYAWDFGDGATGTGD